MKSQTKRSKPINISILISSLLALFLLTIPMESSAQLGLLRKLGKLGSKAGKVSKAGKLGRLGRPSKTLIRGAGLFYADDIIRHSTSQLDEFVGLISRNGDEISIRSNFVDKNPLNITQSTTMNAEEGVGAFVKRHIDLRAGEGNLADDIFEEAFQSGMEFIVDAALLEDEDFEAYDFENLPGLKVRCSDGWARPLIEKGDKKLLAFHQDIPVYVLLENENLFSVLPPLNTLTFNPSDLSFQAIDSTAELPDLSHKESFADELFRQWADSSSWWELSDADNELLATYYTTSGPGYSIKLPQSWIMTSVTKALQSPEPQNDTPLSWIIGGIAVLIVSLFALLQVFQKAGHYGMEGTIPIYNHYRMFEMAGMDGKQILWLLVPFYNIYVYYRFTEKFATNFGLNQKWLHIVGTILPPLLWAYIGFKEDVYYRGPEGGG